MPPAPDTWDRCVSVRLPHAMLDQVLGLRAVLGGVEDATISATLRELLQLALVVIDEASTRRIGEYARHAGITRDQAWQRVVDFGIDALESADDADDTHNE